VNYRALVIEDDPEAIEQIEDVLVAVVIGMQNGPASAPDWDRPGSQVYAASAGGAAGTLRG